MPENTQQFTPDGRPYGKPMLRVGFNSNDVWRDYVEFRFAILGVDGVFIAKPVEFEPPSEEAKASGFADARPAMLTICAKSPEGQAVLQRLIDDLWSMGLRPSDMGTPNQIAAVERHLEDVRTILADQMQVILPGQPKREVVKPL